MLVHIVLLLYICIIGLMIFITGVNRRKNKKFIFLSFFAVFWVEALRGSSVGLDTANYIRGFIVLDSKFTNVYYSWTANSWEPLWRLLNKFIGFFTDNPQWLLIVTSFLILLGIGVFIYYNCEDDESAFWPVFFFMTLGFFYPASMYLLRQYIALIFVINIYTVLKRNKGKKNIALSIFFLIVAFGFHYSAAIGIIVLMISLQQSISRKYLISALGIALVSPITFPLFNLLLARFIPVYAKYLTKAEYQGEDIRLYILVMVFLIILCCLVTLLYLDPGNSKNKDIYTMCLFNIVAIGFMLLQTRTIMSQRFVYYFEIFIILLIPKLIRKMKKSYLWLFVTLMFGWAFFIFVLSRSDGARQIVPYKFFWQ